MSERDSYMDDKIPLRHTAFFGYEAHSVRRPTLNFLTRFIQVVKPKISPKYPVIRRNLNLGLFHYFHYENNSVCKVPRRSMLTCNTCT